MRAPNGPARTAYFRKCGRGHILRRWGFVLACCAAAAGFAGCSETNVPRDVGRPQSDSSPPDASFGTTHADDVLETLVDPLTGQRGIADFSCAGHWHRPVAARAANLVDVAMEGPLFEAPDWPWFYYRSDDTGDLPQLRCDEDEHVELNPNEAMNIWQSGRGYDLCGYTMTPFAPPQLSPMTHYAHEVLPNFVGDRVVRTMNHWTPTYERAVWRAAGRDPRADNRVLEVLAHDCGMHLVGGFGVIVSVDGRDVELRAAQVFRPRLTLPDGVTAYHMESLVAYDLMDRVSGPEFASELVVRTTGRIADGAAEVVIGCEAVTNILGASVSIMVSPLRADYPEGHPCRRYL